MDIWSHLILKRHPTVAHHGNLMKAPAMCHRKDGSGLVSKDTGGLWLFSRVLHHPGKLTWAWIFLIWLYNPITSLWTLSSRYHWTTQQAVFQNLFFLVTNKESWNLCNLVIQFRASSLFAHLLLALSINK